MLMYTYTHIHTHTHSPEQTAPQVVLECKSAMKPQPETTLEKSGTEKEKSGTEKNKL